MITQYPNVTDQTYVVGDPSTKYRFNNYTLGPNPGNCGKNYYYYYA